MTTITMTQAYPIVGPRERRATTGRYQHIARPERVDLGAYVAGRTSHGRPPPMIGSATVLAMQWVVFGAVVLRWLFW